MIFRVFIIWEPGGNHFCGYISLITVWINLSTVGMMVNLPTSMAVNDNGVRGALPESIAAPILCRIRSNFRILSAYILIARRIKRIQKQLKLSAMDDLLKSWYKNDNISGTRNAIATCDTSLDAECSYLYVTKLTEFLTLY
jgi:hypothetical protein